MGSREEGSNQSFLGTFQKTPTTYHTKANVQFVLHLFFTNAMFPCHLGLLLLVSEQRLGDLAGHGPWNRPQVLFRDAPFPQVGFGRQSRWRLMVVVVRVGDVYCMWVVMVEMEVMVVVAIGGYPWGYTQWG